MSFFAKCTVSFSMLVFSSLALADYKRGKFRTIALDGRVTASQVSTAIDVNNDGFTGNLTTGVGRSNYGRLVGRSVSEIKPILLNPADPNSMQSCLMPSGEAGFEFELEAFNGVLRIERLNGAVLLQKNIGTACFELQSCFDQSTGGIKSNCRFFGDWQLDIVGGLAGMKGASGQLTLEGDGTIMLVDPTGNFAGFDGHFFGDIKLPLKRKKRY